MNQLKIIIVPKMKSPINVDVENLQAFQNRSVTSRDILWWSCEKIIHYYTVWMDLWSKFSKLKTRLRFIIVEKIKSPLNVDVKNVQLFPDRSIRSRDILWRSCERKKYFLPRINWSLIEIFENKNSNRDYNFSKNEIAYERRCEKCPRFFTSDI